MNRIDRTVPVAARMRSIAAFATSALVLTACGGGGSAESGAEVGAMAAEVHHDFITGASGEGIDVLEQCEPAASEPTWQLVQYNDLRQLAFREASVGTTDTNVLFLLQAWGSPRMLNLLEPLTAYQQEKPIEDFEGISEELVRPFELDGELYGVPVRTTTIVLMYDQQRLADAGYDSGPATLEDLVDMAISISGQNDSGQPVYGVRFSSADDLAAWVRAYGGDLISDDYAIHLTEKPTLDALSTLTELYEAGAIPENFFNLSADDWLRMEQQGQVGMTLRGSTYYANLDDPDTSRIAGNVGISLFPKSASVGGGPAEVPGATWYMTIPKNATNKDAAWDFIRCVSSPASTVSMTLNNNTPVRPEALDDARVVDMAVPEVREAEQEVLALARPGLPSFDDQDEAVRILQEEMVAAITGQKSPEQAMADATAAIEPMLPKQ